MDGNFFDRLMASIKVNLFLLNNAVFFSANADIALKRMQLDTSITNTFQSASTADRPLEGFTQMKNNKRAEVETKTLLVAAGANSYYTTNPNPGKKIIVDIPKNKVLDARDAELYTLADQIHDVAGPIKATIPPPVTEADVDALPVLNEQYRLLLALPRAEEGISAAARKDSFYQVQEVQYKQILPYVDDLMKPYEFTNPAKFSEYETARMIDNSGGGNGTDGYDVQAITIAPGATVKLFSVPLPDREIYLRMVGDQDFVWLCAAPDATVACSDTGYKLEVATTIKVPYSDLGLGNGAQVNATNIGLTTVTVNAGLKNA